MRFLVLLIALGATACGQTGSLYLPDEQIATPVEIRGPAPAPTPPAAPPVAPPPRADDEKEDPADKTRPPGG